MRDPVITVSGHMAEMRQASSSDGAREPVADEAGETEPELGSMHVRSNTCSKPLRPRTFKTGCSRKHTRTISGLEAYSLREQIIPNGSPKITCGPLRSRA